MDSTGTQSEPFGIRGISLLLLCDCDRAGGGFATWNTDAHKEKADLQWAPAKDIIMLSPAMRKEADMPQLLVRNLEEDTIKRLKALAKQHGRSLQGQVKLVLEEAATLPIGEVSMLLEKWQRRLARRQFSDSAKLIRKDRGR